MCRYTAEILEVPDYSASPAPPAQLDLTAQMSLSKLTISSGRAVQVNPGLPKVEPRLTEVDPRLNPG